MRHLDYMPRVDSETLRALLLSVKRGEVSIQSAASRLEVWPVEELGYAVVDHHRAVRQGMPEVVLGESKTPEQVVGIAQALLARTGNVLITRVDPAKAELICQALPALRYVEAARVLVSEARHLTPLNNAPVCLVTAGTSDIPVAEEAAETLNACGVTLERVYDVGVAGLHRVLGQLDTLRAAPVVIVIAGMEGALSSVIGGLVAAPVIAVPTSVGYGTALSGFTALFGMLTGCAAGVTVVNIDNGFGAGLAAFRILRGAAQ